MRMDLIKKNLIKLPRFYKQSIVIFLDALICASSVWLAFGLQLDKWDPFLGQQWIVLLAAIGFSVPLFIYFGLYRAIFRYIGSAAFISITRVFIIYTGFIFLIFTLVGVDNVPKSIGVIQPILLFIGIGIHRYLIRYWLGDVNNNKMVPHQVRPVALVYGAGSAGRQLVAGLSNNNQILVKGFIDDDPDLLGKIINNLSVYPSVNLKDLITELHITDVLLAIPSVSQVRRSEIIASLSGLGVRVRTLPGMMDIVTGLAKVSELHDLDMNDLLGRAAVPPNMGLMEKNIRNQVILVTGAGGSIGSELCRQIIKFSPKSIILIDISEHSLFLIYEELKKILIESSDHSLQSSANDKTPSVYLDSQTQLVPCLASVRDSTIIEKIFRAHQPQTIFHTAAYKHVPLVEQNLFEGIRNNVFGTITCAEVSIRCGVSHFILVSTDKAVRPTNVMGASKRIAEMVLQAMAERKTKRDHRTIFSIVRFGNVLGSSGSVAPLFNLQIAAGGPITLTHLEVTRYFMTIPEAAQLVIQASAMANGGDVFVLDMGNPVRIYDLAVKMIYLSGLLVKDDDHPHGDIEIKITGLRPGEKLYEELLIGNNPQSTAHPKIMKANEEFLPWSNLQKELGNLKEALDRDDSRLTGEILKKLVPGYQSNAELDSLNG